jgi:hypothetical protein
MNRYALLVVVVIVVLVAGVAVLSNVSNAHQGTVTSSESLSTQTAYTVTGKVTCASFNLTSFATPDLTTASRSSSSTSEYSPPPLKMTVNQGDGVCVKLNIGGSSVSNFTLAAPSSFLLADLPPQYHAQAINGTYVLYSSGVTYDGPVQLDFLFGASAPGNYQVMVDYQSLREAIVSVTVQ